MKTRFRVWLAAAFVGLLTVPTVASAQTKRPDPTHEREKARERREEAKEHKEKREAAQHHEKEKKIAAQERRERLWKEAMAARERRMAELRAKERRDAARWARLRAERAAAHRREIYARWAWAVATPKGKEEFLFYAERMARIHRIRDIAQDRRDTSMMTRVDRVIELENQRHANVIAVIISTR